MREGLWKEGGRANIKTYPINAALLNISSAPLFAEWPPSVRPLNEMKSVGKCFIYRIASVAIMSRCVCVTPGPICFDISRVGGGPGTGDIFTTTAPPPQIARNLSVFMTVSVVEIRVVCYHFSFAAAADARNEIKSRRQNVSKQEWIMFNRVCDVCCGRRVVPVTQDSVLVFQRRMPCDVQCKRTFYTQQYNLVVKLRRRLSSYNHNSAEINDKSKFMCAEQKKVAVI